MIIDHPSPNFNARDPAVRFQYIVLHYTGMASRDEALQRLCDPTAQVSAHYVVDEDGQIYKLVDEHLRAWHAGQSFWRGIRDINSASIGIELVNPGHEFGYRPFPEAQIEALKKLLPDIAMRHKMVPATCLLAHSDIAPTRKQDPGELFPWQDLAKAGFGLWLEPPKDDGFVPASAEEEHELLAQIGYDVTDGAAALIAFQRRYDPQHLTGKPEPATIARLRAMTQALKSP